MIYYYAKQGGFFIKIAEALMERAALKTDLEELKNRMLKNVKIQDGDTIQEDVYTLMDEYMQKQSHLSELVSKINQSNIKTINNDGESLANMLALRDTYKSIVKTYKLLYDEAIITPSRYSRNEIKFISTVDIDKIQAKINEYSGKYRVLDTQIQELNWTVNLYS